MIRSSLLAALGLLAGAAGAMAAEPLQATFVGPDGAEVGTATLTPVPAGVLVAVDLQGVAAGTHGFHFHETGACEGPTFETAGSHFAPGGHDHGLLAETGPHEGDMPNLFAAADGRLQGEVLNPLVTLDDGERGLLDADGSALVVHAGADDHQTDPSGNSGDRIACAVIAAP